MNIAENIQKHSFTQCKRFFLMYLREIIREQMQSKKNEMYRSEKIF